MSAEFHRISYADPLKFYKELQGELRGLYERYWFTNLSNCSAALMAHLPDVNWVGFYIFKDEELRLGPFQGLPACLRIPLGKGVCGTAALQRQPQLVQDVHAFPGHIVCDARSRSELVVPLLHGDRLLGVLDLDSPTVGRFAVADLEGVTAIVRDLVKLTEWSQFD